MLVLALFTLLACTGAADDTASDTDDTVVPTGPGTLALSFRMDADYVATMAEDGQSPIGTFGGSVYAEEDSTGVGPNDGAVALLDFSVPGIDLTVDGGPTTVLLVTEALEPQIVWVLGCLDVDVPTDGCGDVGDPITLPNENKVQVLAGTETPFEVYMGMIRP
ncbi:MAG: hypothetical protein Q8P18_30180 [Pseudomonadota bacterium]|nr:hypothetical protein [Pseudomonadota bacterium]